MGFNKKFFTTGGIVASAPSAAAFDPLQNFETVTYTGNGGTQKITGYIRKGAAFNGSSSKIVTTLNPNGFSQITLSCWINTTSSGANDHIISANDGSNWCFLSMASGIITFGASNGGSSIFSATHTGAINDGNWHHICGTYNGTTATLYIDGTGYTPVSATASLSVNIAFGIGYRNTAASSGTYYDGKIDQVRIFNTGLLEDNNGVNEIQALADETYGDAKNSTTDFFGNGSGVALYELDEDAKDTGDTYNGTPTNIDFLGMAFQPDLVWIKHRDDAGTYHQIYDSVRGAAKVIFSNDTLQEYDRSNGLTSFDSNGFTLGNHAHSNDGTAPNDLVAWCWKAAGAANTFNVLENGTVTSDSTASGAGITAGTITTGWEVSANRDAGFSIVKYTANATSGATIGHGLSQELDLLIVKSTNLSQAWNVYVKDVTDTDAKYLRLNESNEIYTTSFPRFIVGNFTSDVFSVGNDNSTNGISGTDQYIAYCFHSVDGYQKVGSYTGTGAAGNAQNIGFQPRFLMTKTASSPGGSWFIIDSTRSTSNPKEDYLMANLPNDEAVADGITFTSTGFEFSDGSYNQLNYEFIYLAIA